MLGEDQLIPNSTILVMLTPIAVVGMVWPRLGFAALALAGFLTIVLPVSG